VPAAFPHCPVVESFFSTSTRPFHARARPPSRFMAIYRPSDSLSLFVSTYPVLLAHSGSSFFFGHSPSPTFGPEPYVHFTLSVSLFRRQIVSSSFRAKCTTTTSSIHLIPLGFSPLRTRTIHILTRVLPHSYLSALSVLPVHLTEITTILQFRTLQTHEQSSAQFRLLSLLILVYIYIASPCLQYQLFLVEKAHVEAY